jgi:hypothetical protein
MHKNATKYNETLNKWCKNKHRASKIMDTLETYQRPKHALRLVMSPSPRRTTRRRTRRRRKVTPHLLPH